MRRADRLTLFLDEIAELPEESQTAPVRVLHEGEVRPIGSCDTINVNVHVTAATHQDLEARIADGCFRQDFYLLPRRLHRESDRQARRRRRRSAPS